MPGWFGMIVISIAASGCAALDAFECNLSPKPEEQRTCHEQNRRRQEARIQRTSIEGPSCERGDLAACERAGRLAQEEERDYDVAADSYGRACQGGIGSACRKLGLLHHDGRIPGTRRVPALPLLERACSLGDAEGCAIAVPMAGPQQRTSLAERACTLGGQRCAIAGAAMETTDLARASRLYRRGCSAGDEESCVAYGRVKVKKR